MALIQKAFSDIITFSRSSNATRIGPTGLVEYAPHNLLTYSQQFDNASWNKSNVSVTANTTAAPDGSVTADQVTVTTASFPNINQSAGTLAATQHTVSFFVKAGTSNWMALQLSDGVANANGRYFDASSAAVGGGVGLSSGSAVTVASSTATSVGNGWVRCSITFNISNATTYAVVLYIVDGNNSTSVTNGRTISFWGAQLAVGPYALDYTPTTSAAVYGPRFDYDGSSVTAVQPIARNLLLYSEEFDNAYWTKTRSSITTNAATAPDGTVTADKLVEDSSNNSHIVSSTSVASLTSTAYTGSVYIKAGERTFSQVQVIMGGVNTYAIVNLSNGAIGTVTGDGSFSAVNVGNGWYRISVTFTTSSIASGQLFVYPASSATTFAYQGDGNSGVFIWGAQIELGNTATDYMVSGATNGFRAVPVVTGGATPRGLLIEEQRTNLLTYSEQFDNAAWTKSNSTITANSVAAPDGTVTADTLVEDTSTGAHQITQAYVAASGTVVTFSVYVKQSQRSWMRITVNTASGANASAYFDVSAGTVGAVGGGTASITPVGNGWFRCSVTGTLTTTNPTLAILLANGNNGQSYTGDGTSGIYIWGAQLEAGAFATSYIPTVAASVTRSADVASVNTLSPWFNATEGTFLSNVSPLAIDNDISLSASDSGGYANSMYLPADSGAQFIVVNSSVVEAQIDAGTILANTPNKIAAAYAANNFALSVNGGAVVTDTSGAIPTVDRLVLGGLEGNTANRLNGHLRQVAYYPRRLTNAELQALTA
jgi:hypothetical protein